MKGAIQANRITINKFQFKVLGLLDLTVVETSDFEEVLQTTTLPDQTEVSGGETEPLEFELHMPMHHLAEQAAMELWWAETKAGLPTYKKPGTLKYKHLDGKSKDYTFTGVFPFTRVLPGGEMANEGEMGIVVWKFKADSIVPL